MNDVVTDLVSTIIPVYNRVAMLRDAVNSVLAQSHRPIEIIIVDNASTDDTPREAAWLAQSHPGEVRVTHCMTRGAGAAREVGRRLARGEFIQYLDSDDLLMPDKFTLQIAALRLAPDCAIAYGITRCRDLSGKHSGDRSGERLREPWKGTGERVERLFPSMLLERWWDTSTPLYRSETLRAAGAWLNLRNEEDWEYDCRLAAMNVCLAWVPELVSETREHDGDRLSFGVNGREDETTLAARAEARTLIRQHASRAGISRSTPEMQHFSRSLFLLARQCGAAGLTRASRDLFDLSRECAQPAQRNAADYRLYALIAKLVGWRMTGKLSAWRDQWRARGKANVAR